MLFRLDLNIEKLLFATLLELGRGALCVWVLPSAKRQKIVVFILKHELKKWSLAGKIQQLHSGGHEPSNQDDRAYFDQGGIRLTVGPNGTEIRWLTQSRCISSLFAVLEWLPQAALPIVLRYYASGWFEEFHNCPAKASKRIEAIISRCDRHFPNRTFIQEVEFSDTLVAAQLMDIYRRPETAEDYSVECEYSPNRDRFAVERIGALSPIAKFYGIYTNSYPCTVSSYGDKVSAGYRSVLNSGRARVDHVLAAFRLPDNQVHWVPYHRLIMPVLGAGKSNRVQVVSKISKVAFQVI